MGGQLLDPDDLADRWYAVPVQEEQGVVARGDQIGFAGDVTIRPSLVGSKAAASNRQILLSAGGDPDEGGRKRNLGQL
jgi:hypothetical protein